MWLVNCEFCVKSMQVYKLSIYIFIYHMWGTPKPAWHEKPILTRRYSRRSSSYFPISEINTSFVSIGWHKMLSPFQKDNYHLLTFVLGANINPFHSHQFYSIGTRKNQYLQFAVWIWTKLIHKLHNRIKNYKYLSVLFSGLLLLGPTPQPNFPSFGWLLFERFYLFFTRVNLYKNLYNKFTDCE
jgi:hypothetical protein